MPIIEVINLDKTNPSSRWLAEHKEVIYSQWGEEGVIKKIFEVIGENNKWCVEFGAWDGYHLSNTRHLIVDHGWSSVQIEGNPKKYPELARNYSGFDRVACINSVIGFTPGLDTIEDALASTDVPIDFDMISIDVDGVDYYIWESIVKYHPRLVVIEINPSVPNDVIFVQDRDLRISQGCSLSAVIRLGKNKGYELVFADKCNAFFVRSEYFSKFNIIDNSAMAMFPDPRGRIWYGHDGTIYNSIERMMWQNITVAPDALQILDKHERRFRDHAALSGK